MDNKQEPKKCCSNLKCVQTAELEKTIAVELEQQDRPLEELFDVGKEEDSRE